MFAALTLSFSASMHGQAQPTKRADLADKRACYEQAQKYVADRNAERATEKIQQGSPYRFELAHYDATTQVCYVQLERDTPSFPPGSKSHAVVEEILVVDAFEGQTIAFFVGGWTANEKGALTFSEPTACHVNGEKCHSRPAFNGLLWKLIPAFQPVDAEDAK